MNYDALFVRLRKGGFHDWVKTLSRLRENWFNERHHGDYARWAQAFEILPDIEINHIDFSLPALTIEGTCKKESDLNEALSILKPWRKGPYQIADTHIDTEWRSDYKWDRLRPHLSSLHKRKILDVGCGNGYHGWRMLEDEPELVIGIDPSVLFNLQHQVMQHYIRDERFYLLPLTIQQLPNNLQWFDTVFSMGVLYHRKSPIDHLLHLKSLLKAGGELCLETLIITGGPGQVLVPGPRYARMNNVWFLPSAEELCHWLDRCGYKNIRLVNENQTCLEEQRSTEWMPFESLRECLREDDLNYTIEGYPAPLRAVVMATK